MLLIVIGIGLYYNVIIAWIIYYLIEVFIRCLPEHFHGSHVEIGTGKHLKIVDEPFFFQLEHGELHGYQL